MGAPTPFVPGFPKDWKWSALSIMSWETEGSRRIDRQTNAVSIHPFCGLTVLMVWFNKHRQVRFKRRNKALMFCIFNIRAFGGG
ncbi:hypothetical protein XELAEV_18016031mg [Xenopus laevis]|uniref:Uncharacterized protein n=1 Tax=Xenopus laevis TaxID=8355 RepID=A0A974DJD2_XENLA|nr:hypothetical protein XELAEV_18016031mg [Xenopus laevis]